MSQTTYAYTCSDEGGGEAEIVAADPAEAAAEYVADGDWGDIDSTTWVRVRVAWVDEDGDEQATHERVTIDPDEPPCLDRSLAHDWQSPHEVLGGLRENPGVWGNGGGTITREVCAHCGRYRRRNTWAHDPETGEQGLESISYPEADDDSRAWVESLTQGEGEGEGEAEAEEDSADA